MSKVLFQWVDGGILRQFQLEKDTVQYRILMSVVNEVKQSLEENAAAAEIGAGHPYRSRTDLFRTVAVP
ncbi:hypothetical protein AAVH_19715 [Aphelenchoides avenae]|nr:hypothetical protein AAVH_19715 [Aphelenchus avenae]